MYFMGKKIKTVAELIRVFAKNDCTQSEISEICYDLYYVTNRVMKIPDGDYTDEVAEFYRNKKRREAEQNQD